ncbi:MAG TPA: hypothetical protein VHY30_04820 [Verrucomicrobiae bacterium]|jgi:hypothetical protein|nr:hypothetical protein [Verrucomicrobiae bacterium]
MEPLQNTIESWSTTWFADTSSILFYQIASVQKTGGFSLQVLAVEFSLNARPD